VYNRHFFLLEYEYDYDYSTKKIAITNAITISLGKYFGDHDYIIDS